MYLKKLTKRTTVALFMCLLCSINFAQNRSISGVIKDTSGEAMIGVSVFVKDTSNGIITDIDGKYVLSGVTNNSVLVISYVGYIKQEITVGNQTLINVTMEESAQNLDEVVVVGYGVQKKSHLTGSISKYKDEKMGDLAISRLDQALQGKIAGLSIQNTTTEAGATPEIRVRGMGSISASNEPLVVVDGYPMSDGLAFIDMNDVESVEVLKDAASSAIYGSRGANGVILITTKSGNISKPKYSVKAYSGIKTVYKYHDLLSANDYVAMLKDEAAKGGTGPTTAERAWQLIDNYTDWQREGTRDIAWINNVQFSLSGGKKESKYYISSSYTSDEGIMLHSKYDRFNLKAKIDAILSPHVEMGLNLTPAFTRKESPANNFIDFYRTYTWLPVRHTEVTSAITGYPVGSYAHGRHFNNKNYADPETGEVITASPWGTANNNPRAIMDNETRFSEDYRLNTSAYLNLKLAKGLTFKTTNGFYVRYQDYNLYHNSNARSDGDANYGRYTNSLLIDLLSENVLNYNKTIKKNSFDVMVGYTANYVKTKAAGIQGTGFPNDYVKTINAATNIVILDTDGTRRTYTTDQESMLLSGLGRLTYSYDDKYLFSGSLRADASSKFGPENQLAWFPALSVGWRISEEEFVRKLVTMDQLKLRASWGITGNDDIPNYVAYDKLQNANYVFGTGSVLIPGLANTSNVLGNKAITWEQTSEFDAGFDLSILKSRVNLTMDYYYSITRSLLFEQPAMAITGYSQFWNNIGKVRNRGIEIELNTYNIKNKKFEWQTTLNFSTNDNLLLQLGGEGQLLSFGERNEVYVGKVGYPSIQYYGYKTDGVWLTQEDINNSGLTFSTGKTVKPGTLKVVNQNDDNVIDAYDRG
jgi:TonB-linked SusC/RagA family outer membrane protein